MHVFRNWDTHTFNESCKAIQHLIYFLKHFYHYKCYDSFTKSNSLNFIIYIIEISKGILHYMVSNPKLRPLMPSLVCENLH